MLCCKVVAVFLCVLTIVHGMPQNGDGTQGSSGLPFIQFSNGGIRFNFGGYHAAAGLGGLLGGSRTGGGLHASVGTPWGGHASAGLGGALGGEDVGAGGGLYARAGLGSGRSEVAAGLGGVLGGSGRSGGGLFAGGTMGDRGVGVSVGSQPGNNGPNSPNASNGQNESTHHPSDTGNGEKPNKGTSNIQFISHPGKKPHKIKQSLDESTTTETSKQIVPASNKEMREVHSTQSTPTMAASAFETLSVDPLPLSLVGKAKFIGGVIPEAPLAPPLPSQLNEVIQIEQRPRRVKYVYPKWVSRKRIWGPRKQIIINASGESLEKTKTKESRKRRQAPNNNSNRSVFGSNGVRNDKGDSYFDNIFQIPVSTLNAVNRFLNNNAS